MFSDPYTVLTKDLTSAFVVGSATVDGSPCEHLAFKSRGVHWEIWVETGEKALRAIGRDLRRGSEFPRFLVEFSNWNLQPSLTPDSFAFSRRLKPKKSSFVPRRPRRPDGNRKELKNDHALKVAPLVGIVAIFVHTTSC